MKQDKLKMLHIVVIVIGIIFVFLGAFHTNLWFDETYSVALVNNHNFTEIWNIDAHDVHPVLYYFMLKIINLVFGNSILAYRLFSVIGIAILGILGFTHIRKDFGEKTGILFSVFSFFLPIMSIYASEIRMYSWAITFVTLTAIYAYRLTKENKIKNWILFGIFSLICLYIHYYGVMAAGLINLALFIYFIKKEDLRKKYLCRFLVTGFLQFILYMPWLINFIRQLKAVSSGFWISLEFPGTIFKVLDFQFTGNLDERVGIVLGYSLILYCIYIFKKMKTEKQDVFPGKISIILYGSVILAALVLSLKTPILYPRYLFTVTGLLIFALSFFIAKSRNNKVIVVICIITVLLSIISNTRFILTNYDTSNETTIKYIEDNLSTSDIVIYKNQDLGTGSVIAVRCPNTKQYFYNKEDWNVEEAYKAYSPTMNIVKNLDFLNDYAGKIWIIDSADFSLYNELKDIYPNISIVNKNTYNTKYQNYQYNIVVIEKAQ